MLLADDLVDDSSLPCLAAMLQHFMQCGQSIIAVQAVPWDEVHRYGVIKVSKPLEQIAVIHDIVEKPQREFAPSNLAAIGRYIFTPAIFQCLKQTASDIYGEIQLTGGIRHLLATDPVQAYLFNGTRYDCGSKLGYLQAIVEMGIRHAEVGPAFCNYLHGRAVCVSR